MKLNSCMVPALAAGLLMAALFGCQKHEGPVEQAGKVVDQTVEKAGQQIEKAGDKLQDVANGGTSK